MASLIARPASRFWVQLRVGSSRRTIRLGRASRRAAETARTHIEALASADELNVEPDTATAVWLAGVGDVLRSRIAAAGLAVDRVRVTSKSTPLGAFVDAFLADYVAGSSVTAVSIRVALARIREHFGDDCPIRSITDDDAKGWRRAAEEKRKPDGEPLWSEATISNSVKKARQLWAAGLETGMVTANPWLAVRASSMTNELRQFYVTPDTAATVLEACPDVEWRLMFALCRFAGLRFCSEHMKLKRADVDWARSRFLVHGKGKKDRWVPIFPELRPHLEAAEAAASKAARVVKGKAAKATAYLIVRRRFKPPVLRRQFLAILDDAVIDPWPRLFHNLRSSCQTALVSAGHPPFVVAKWLGNSEEVARRHYLQVTEEDFERATEQAAGGMKAK